MKHTGECSRAEVERAAAARRAEMAERRLASLNIECRKAQERVASLEGREREARQKAQAAAAELIKVSSGRVCLCDCMHARVSRVSLCVSRLPVVPRVAFRICCPSWLFKRRGSLLRKQNNIRCNHRCRPSSCPR